MLPVLQALTGYPAAFIILNAFDLYVPGGVYVSVEIGLALGALPESVRQFEVIVDVAADMTGLGRGEISVGIKQQLASLVNILLLHIVYCAESLNPTLSRFAVLTHLYIPPILDRRSKRREKRP